MAFEEKDVAADRACRDEMIKKTGQLGVPVIDVDGSCIIGFDEHALKAKLGIK